MYLNSINRYYAFGGHLIASACVVLALAGIIFTIWYPGALAYASGVMDVFLILVFVDVVLGPSITLLIFNPQKKELKKDLIIIVAIQLIALFYGIFTVFTSRPAYIVFNAKGFDLVYANEISPENLAKTKSPEYSHLPYFGPKLVSANLPSDPVAAKRIILEAVHGGEDVQNMPQYYTQYKDLKQRILIAARPIENLKKVNAGSEIEIQLISDKYSAESINIGYLPITAKAHNVTAIIDKDTLEILEISTLNPS